MIKVKNIWHREVILGGIVVKPGEVKTIPECGEIGYCLARDKIRIIKTNERLYERTDLRNLKMSELRKIGDPLGAKDTSKEELIDEIIEKQEVE